MIKLRYDLYVQFKNHHIFYLYTLMFQVFDYQYHMHLMEITINNDDTVIVMIYTYIIHLFYIIYY